MMPISVHVDLVAYRSLRKWPKISNGSFVSLAVLFFFWYSFLRNFFRPLIEGLESSKIIFLTFNGETHHSAASRETMVPCKEISIPATCTLA